MCLMSMFSGSWFSLGIMDFNFLEFLSLGNNFLLMWVILLWLFYFFLSIFYFSSFYLIYFLNFYNLFYLKESYKFLFLVPCFLFYEYFSMIFPFMGIFLSLALNFLILSINSLDILGINFFMLVMGKQWNWDFFYCFQSFNFSLFLLSLIKESNYYFWFCNSEVFMNMSFKNEVNNLFFNSSLDSYFSDEFFLTKLIYTSCNSLIFSKDWNSEGMKNSIFLLKDCVAILLVTSLDVIHSLGIPLLGFKLDLVPGFFSGEIFELESFKMFDNLEFGCFEYCRPQPFWHVWEFDNFSLSFYLLLYLK